MRFATTLSLFVLLESGVAQTPRLVKDIRPGGGGANPAHLVAMDGQIYFAADDGQRGIELWASDGSVGGTRLIKDCHPGSGSGSPNQLTVVGKQLFFSAADPVHGRELWVSDGTSAGTRVVRDIVSGTTSCPPSGLTALGNILVFSCWDRTANRGGQVWVSDGTAQGTREVAAINTLNNSVLTGLVPFRGALYFAGVSATGTGQELWRTDGTGAGTYLVKDTNPQSSGGVSQLAAIGGRLYFQANDGVHGIELWSSDGSGGGTQMLKDINPGTKLDHSRPTGFADFGGSVLFSAYNKTTGQELWISNGLAAGTRLFADVRPGSLGSDPKEITYLGAGVAVCSVYLTGEGRELLSINPVQVTPIVLRAGTAHGSPGDFIRVGNMGFFRAISATRGQELWMTDGEAGNTQIVREIYPGSTTAAIHGLTVAGCNLFFRANSPGRGYELWKLPLWENDVSRFSVQTIRLSFKRIRDRDNSFDPAWTDSKIQAMVQRLNTILDRTARLRCEYEVVDLVDPGIPLSWQTFDSNRITEYEAAAEADPCRYRWRADAINIVLCRSIPGAVGFCSFPACPGNNNDLVVLRPSPGEDARNLAHELGHYFNLVHTHGRYEGSTCDCGGGAAGDCVDDTPDDHNPANCKPLTRSCHEAGLKALRLPSDYYRLLRFNVMSYHDPIAASQAVLSCGQADRLRAALLTYRQHVIKGRPRPTLLNITPNRQPYPGPRSLTLSGSNLPSTGTVQVRAGAQLATVLNPGATSYRVNFPQAVEPGRHCVAAYRDGRILDSVDGGLQVGPSIYRDPDLDAAGRVTLVFRATMPNASMIVAIGPEIPGLAIAPAQYLLRINPLVTFPLQVGAQGEAPFKFDPKVLPAAFRTRLQAVEIGAGQLLSFSNALPVVIP